MTSGIAAIKQYLGALAPSLDDPDVSEIQLNPDGAVFLERWGMREKLDESINPIHVEEAFRRIAIQAGEEVMDSNGNLISASLQCRFSDCRVAVLWPPYSVGGPSVTIRRFNVSAWALNDYVASGTLTPDQAARLHEAAILGKNILISGETGCGKSSLLNVIGKCIPVSRRLILIENPSELLFEKPNILRWEARKESSGLAVTQRELVQQALRHHPDAIWIGEIRGAESMDFIVAMNTGHRGCATTTHANSAEDAIERLAICALMAGDGMPESRLIELVRRGLDLVVHMQMVDGKRKVAEIMNVNP